MANIIGTNDDDMLAGSSEDDNIEAGAGNDRITTRGGNDVTDGGLGIDTITDADFSAATFGLNIDDSGATRVSLPIGDSVVNIENFEIVVTGSGNDTINFTTRRFDNELIDTGAGDDIINSGLGKDRVDGGTGLDTLVVDYSAVGSIGNGLRSLGVSDNGTGSFSGTYYTINSASSYERVDFNNIEQFIITGTAFDDEILTGSGNDRIDAGSGNDIITSGAGNDLINGGAGIDTLIDAYFSSATFDLNIDDSGATKISLNPGDTVLNVENFQNLLTGSGNDTIAFTNRFDNIIINTGSGNDIINSGLGNDTVNGGAGIDTLVVDYSGANSAVGMSSVATDNGSGSFSGHYYAFYKFDVNNIYDWVNFSNIEHFNITGTALNDNIVTGSGNDRISAGAGNDTLTSGAGNDVIDGGTGIDILTDADFSTATFGLTIDDSGKTTIALTSRDSVSNIENFQNLITGKGNDKISFTARFNNTSINTGAGNDTINSGLGQDNVNGGSGTDTLVVDYSATDLTSGLFSVVRDDGGGSFSGSYLVYNNVTSYDNVNFSNIERFNITGTGLDDNILTGTGNDTINGGAGNDTINSDAGNDNINGGAGNDVINSGIGSDNMNGAAGNDSLFGDFGNDILNGAAGNDILIGGAGDDTLTGGAGLDRFVFNTNRSFSMADLGLDRITDLTASDRIALGKNTFTELTTAAGSVLAASEFAEINDAVNGATLAGSSAARIVFNRANGDLFYNADGLTAGLGSGGRFASLAGITSLSNTSLVLQ